MKLKWSGAALLLLATSVSADPATLVRDSDMRAKAAIDAPVVESLLKGNAVDLLSSQGGWSKIKSQKGKSGFVRLLDVRANAESAGGMAAGVGKLGNVVRTGSTGAVATTGVKGVTKEDIEKSTPNYAEVEKLDGFAVSANAARSTAKKNKLVAQTLPYIENK